jgi:hypothetical protein
MLAKPGETMTGEAAFYSLKTGEATPAGRNSLRSRVRCSAEAGLD